MRGITALGAAVALGASLGAGVQVTNLDPGQNARAETRGPTNPATPDQTRQQSAPERLFYGTGTGTNYNWNIGGYIRRPLGSVARDKRAARKRRNVARSRPAPKRVKFRAGGPRSRLPGR